MTYFQFHFVFTLPLLALLVWLRRKDFRRSPPLLALLGGFNVLAALLYTTPWDNYLLFRGVWTYPPGRVTHTLGYVPIEEYLFFILQPTIVTLWTLGFSKTEDADLATKNPHRRAWYAMALIYFAALVFGGFCLFREQSLYLGLILVWACPVLFFQWLFGGAEILKHPATFLKAIFAPTLYFWFADAIAIHLHIWQISEKYTLNIKVWDLPLEEMVFFFVTDLILVQSAFLLRQRYLALSRIKRVR